MPEVKRGLFAAGGGTTLPARVPMKRFDRRRAASSLSTSAGSLAPSVGARESRQRPAPRPPRDDRS